MRESFRQGTCRPKAPCLRLPCRVI
ncbi:UNVERIFIED_CONTAM: hypothetical protein GTU68_022212 [Idotea baltica]|nr:hypothetical protein [Idotea baltica]